MSYQQTCREGAAYIFVYVQACTQGAEGSVEPPFKFMIFKTINYTQSYNVVIVITGAHEKTKEKESATPTQLIKIAHLVGHWGYKMLCVATPTENVTATSTSLARPAPHTLCGKRVWSNPHVAFVFNTPQFLWRVNNRLSV